MQLVRTGAILALALPAAAQRSLFTVEGHAPGDMFGRQIRQAGDVDADGAPDFLVGSVETVTVLSGATLQPIHVLTGTEGNFGVSFDGLGDLDADGHDDFAVSEVPGGTVIDLGKVFVYSGRDGSLLYVLGAAGAGVDIFGWVVRGCGDLDGDGRRDLLVQAVELNNHAEKSLIAYSGGYGTELFRIAGPSDSSTRFAEAFTDLGDVDQDGVTDFVVGDENYFSFDGPTRGRALVYSGADQSVLYTLFGNHLSYGFPQVLAPTGDLDGDGAPELLVSSEEASAGIVRVHSGATGALLHTLTDPHESEEFGQSLSRAGDVDGDGTEDFVVGAPGSLPFVVGAGAAYVYSGAIGQELFHVEGETFNLYLGSAVAAAGDRDGDGLDDVLVGQPGRTSSSEPGQVLGVALGHSPIEFGFELADDFETLLPNGLRVDVGDTFGERFWIRSAGSHNFGAAVFDSSPTGPNAGGGDPELLVDQGNVLILQGSAAQGAPGAFDPPTDAEGGGTLRFELRSPARLLSIDLVSLAKTETSALVRLVDRSGRTRTYTVPGCYTADAVVAPTEAVQTLDLTTLDPQPGYLASATASENDGFAPPEVTTVEILLTSSGAVDRLVYLPSGEPELERLEELYSVPQPSGSSSFGEGLGRVGDTDGDGHEDFVVSDHSSAGDRVQLRSGAGGQLLHEFLEPVTQSGFGTTAGGVGDVDGDGVPDIGIGAWLADLPGAADAGVLYVYSGSTHGLLMELHGQPNDQLGVDVAGMGDVDGDGRDDFAVGSRQVDDFRGRIEIRSGATGTVLVAIPGSVPGAILGTQFRNAGDVNADGVADIVAYEEGGGLDNAAGRLAVFSGADGALLMERIGTEYWQFLGAGSSAAGDVDLDGHDDVLFADRNWRNGAGERVGRLQVLSGRDGGVLHEITGSRPGGSLGMSTGTWNDQDGDGHPDFAALEIVELSEPPTTARRLRLYSGKTGAVLAQRDWIYSEQATALEPAGDLDGDGIEELLVHVNDFGGSGTRIESLSVRRVNASVVCTGEDNSTGNGARLWSNGHFSATDDSLELAALNLPDKALALLISSPAFQREAHPFVGGTSSSGVLCLLRLPVTRHGFAEAHGGTASFAVDLDLLPGALPNTAALIGTTELFQVVYRDSGSSGDTNFSDAIVFEFE